MSTWPNSGTVTIATRTEKAAEKAGCFNGFGTARTVCTCGHRGKWTSSGHARDLLATHRCFGSLVPVQA